MAADRIRRASVMLFVLLFFLYLFGPLIVMGLTAFNSASFPRVSPWDCFTVEWFEVLINDSRLMEGVRNSFVIGFGVVALAVPIGLAGALMLTQVSQRVRPWYYTIVISPILVPGVVLGISTLIFWDRLGRMFNASYDSIFYDGIFMTVIGQTTFISAYTMLVFISRLQRFDPALEEAALDLGATHAQTFRKILLPFLKPAIASAAVLAFLASFENYNTTVFTITSESTLTTVLASKVRYGINPSVSALAVVIITLTLLGAAIMEVRKRRMEKFDRAVAAAAAGSGEALARIGRSANRLIDPAFAMILLVFLAGLGSAYYRGTVGVDQCKVAVREQRQLEIQQRIAERRRMQMFESAAPADQVAPAAAPAPSTGVQARGTEGYRGIFAPTNLQSQVQSGETDAGETAEGAPARGTEVYQGIFAPTNLQGQVRSGEADGAAEEAPGDAPAGSGTRARGTEGYQGVFDPGNLRGQAGAGAQ